MAGQKDFQKVLHWVLSVLLTVGDWGRKARWRVHYSALTKDVAELVFHLVD